MGLIPKGASGLMVYFPLFTPMTHAPLFAEPSKPFRE